MSRQPSVKQSQFARVGVPSVPRSKFNQSRSIKTTLNAGLLYPLPPIEVLPADTHIMRCTMFGRFLTLLNPIMDNLHLDIQWWFVPYRLVWDNWVRLQGERPDPDSSVDFLTPVISADSSVQEDTIYDYMGLPLQFYFGETELRVQSAPFRAYTLIWNEWYRDQDLQPSYPLDTGDGPDNNDDFELLPRGKRHDYFTSARPSPQKGDAVAMPLVGNAPVYGDGNAIGLTNNDVAGPFGMFGARSTSTQTTGIIGYSQTIYGDPVGTSFNRSGTTSYESDALGIGVVTSGVSGLTADLTGSSAVDINILRQAITMQHARELDMRGGTRYAEILPARFGVHPQDFRLQRPEYLGGSSDMINVSTIEQTSETTDDSAIGDLGAKAQGISRSRFTYSAVEHGFILGLVSIRADLTYQQGLNRMWTRRTRHDFYEPIFANLGEQSVFNYEIFYAGNQTTDLETFGYQERWAEYRYTPSFVTGKFRSLAQGSLDPWHLAIDFPTTPVLNSNFIAEDPPIDRVVAVQDEPHFKLDAWLDHQAIRPMPVMSVPGLRRI